MARLSTSVIALVVLFMCVPRVSAQCSSHAECPSSSCAIGKCDDGTCSLVHAPDGTSCDDADSETDSDNCFAGQCVGVSNPFMEVHNNGNIELAVKTGDDIILSLGFNAESAGYRQTTVGTILDRLDQVEGAAATAQEGVDAIDFTDVENDIEKLQEDRNTHKGLLGGLRTDVNKVGVDLTTESDRAMDMESKLKANITANVQAIVAETIRAQAVEDGLEDKVEIVEGDLATETTRATNAELALQNSLNSAIGRLNALETFEEDTEVELKNLATSITGEKSRATGAEATLDEAISALDRKLDQKVLIYDQNIIDLQQASSSLSNTLNNKIDTAVDSLSSATAQVRTDMTNLITSTSGTITTNLNALQTDVTRVNNCLKDGRYWDTTVEACKDLPTLDIVKLPTDVTMTTCDASVTGSLRFTVTGKEVEVCDGSDWISVRRPQIGSITSPGTSCDNINNNGGAVKGDGRYYIKAAGQETQQVFCIFGEQTLQIGFGSAQDGNLVISGETKNIEDVFSGYDPRAGNVPHFNEVTLNNGAWLTTSEYNPNTNKGGLISFFANKVTICSNCGIHTNGKGHPGGADKFGNSGYGTDVRNNQGSGPGAGIGGKGGFGCCHGSGGGGGSFITRGGTGTPDMCRQHNDYSAVSGSTYSPGPRYEFTADPQLGSGGGAGGPGHPGSSYCAPGSGGRGGGAIQIFAKTLQNSGTLSSTGEMGNPKTSSCGDRWPNDNPQVGSGGSGSGGLIKVVTVSGHIGKTDIKGGDSPIQQNWCSPTNRNGQRGGRGGDGAVLFAGIDWDCEGTCDELGSRHQPAQSCQELYDAGERGNAPYWIGPTPERAAKWQCFLDTVSSGYSYGSGIDGPLDLTSGEHFIEDLFPGYNPRIGVVPQYTTVKIRSGAKLTTRAHDTTSHALDPLDSMNGGMVAFMASVSVTIDSGGSIDVSEKGWSGGWQRYDRTDYPSEIRSPNGYGPGAGVGGRGGKSCCHGSGGGGGSFGSAGGVGEPDSCRDAGDRSAVAGSTYNMKAIYFHPDEVMGSGGATGGPGHPSSCACASGTGGRGGGTVQIMTASFTNNGAVRSNGEQGLPKTNICSWGTGNPQSGSGGAGSGGLIKIVTAAGAAGSLSVSGGGMSVQEGWCGVANAQIGGVGGGGRTSFKTATVVSQT